MKSLIKKWWFWLGVIVVFVLGILFFVKNYGSMEVNSDIAIQYKLGDIITLSEKDKELLKNKTENYIKENLKSPSTAEFEESFEYICDEGNIIKVKGYVDSQNSFGAMIRGKFVCEYFAIDGVIDTLVYLKYDDTELLNIKDTYIEKYKKQAKVDALKQEGNSINQNKLDYIMNDFNENELNDVGKILKIQYEENETKIDVKITAKSSEKSKEDEEYWTNFNICSILEYFNEFDIIGIVKMQIYNIKDQKIVEINFDDDFIKNKWKKNHQINLVKEIFGENYKIIN